MKICHGILVLVLALCCFSSCHNTNGNIDNELDLREDASLKSNQNVSEYDWLYDYYKENKSVLKLLKDEAQMDTILDSTLNNIKITNIIKKHLENNNLEYSDVFCENGYMGFTLNTENYDVSSWKTLELTEALSNIFSEFRQTELNFYPTLRIYLKVKDKPRITAVEYRTKIAETIPALESTAELIAQELLDNDFYGIVKNSEIVFKDNILSIKLKAKDNLNGTDFTKVPSALSDVLRGTDCAVKLEIYVDNERLLFYFEDTSYGFQTMWQKGENILSTEITEATQQAFEDCGIELLYTTFVDGHLRFTVPFPEAIYTLPYAKAISNLYLSIKKDALFKYLKSAYVDALTNSNSILSCIDGYLFTESSQIDNQGTAASILSSIKSFVSEYDTKLKIEMLLCYDGVLEIALKELYSDSCVSASFVKLISQITQRMTESNLTLNASLINANGETVMFYFGDSNTGFSQNWQAQNYSAFDFGGPLKAPGIVDIHSSSS